MLSIYQIRRIEAWQFPFRLHHMRLAIEQLSPQLTDVRVRITSIANLMMYGGTQNDVESLPRFAQPRKSQGIPVSLGALV